MEKFGILGKIPECEILKSQEIYFGESYKNAEVDQTVWN